MKIAVAGSTGLIGHQVVTEAKAQGHDVIELARSLGFDLLAPDARLVEGLRGADAVINVTQGPQVDDKETMEFFVTGAENLGRAATEAGVARTVVLSIVGTDLSPDFGYYVAKAAQEDATRANSPGPLVVRATQFHEFPGQMLAWNRDGNVAHIIDVPLRPVASAAVARVLIEAATGEIAGDVDLAGPKAERLVDLVERLVEHDRLDLTVEAMDAPASMANGSMLPGPDAILRGPDWGSWLASR